MEDSLRRFPGLQRDGEFKGLIAPLIEAPKAAEEFSDSFVIKDAFKVHTLCVVGAIIQVGLSYFLPQPWSFVPAFSLGLSSIVTTVLQLLLYKNNNSFAPDIVPGRTTAQMPLSGVGFYGSVPAARPLVVFHFGVRFNHPLGVLSPGAREAGAHFRAILGALNEDRESSVIDGRESSFGLLGASHFRGGERDSHATLLYILYFEHMDGLRRFAESQAHQMGMRFLQNPRHSHISAFHETFHVLAGNYETMYVNSAPVLLGGTAKRCYQMTEEALASYEDIEACWVSPLVSANTPRLTTMAARLRGGEHPENEI